MGVVYAFLSQGFFDENRSRVLKVGRTTNWEQRREAYTGLDKPDDSTLLVKETLNSELLEKTLKRMLCEMFAVHSGYERFIVPFAYTPAIIQWIATTIDIHPLNPNIHGMSYGEAQNCKRKFDQENDLYIEQLKAENAVLRSSSGGILTTDLYDQTLLPHIKSIKTGVKGVVEIWSTIVQPLECVDSSWRSASQLGDKKAHCLQQSLSAYYYPILMAVMQRHIDGGMDLNEAICNLELLRNGEDLSKFADSLPKCDSNAKKRYKRALLQLPPPLTYSIGSTEWKTKLSETERVESIKPILNALTLTSVKDVRTLICKYRDLIQPLDNIPFKRGYRWRDTRFIGQQKSQAFSDNIIKIYEPILCAVVEEMNLKNVDIWTASESLEQMRLSDEIQGAWRKLVETHKVSRYKTAHSRYAHLKKLQQIFSNCGESYQ